MENSFIIWLQPKEITSKKDGKKYNIFSGKLNFEGKSFDLSGFKTEANGDKPAYIRGQVKEEYQSKPAENKQEF